MRSRTRGRTPTSGSTRARRTLSLAAAGLTVAAIIVGAVAARSTPPALLSSGSADSSGAVPSDTVQPSDHDRPAGATDPSSSGPSDVSRPLGPADGDPGQPGRTLPGGDGIRSETDGALPEGATVFDEYPGLANLDPALLQALRAAATTAAGAAVTFYVTSGWRSPEYQNQLLREAIVQHGSAEEAARWVASPDKSLHVSGDAVDLGEEAAAWLAQHGPSFGLCQVYLNEPWHYELRPTAVERGCPRPYADPTQDPRLR
ncbi:MAG: D-alanyl-D-alanine carboxypeptidase family protein [Propionibacteriaceae bacterium]|jgi:hypothetical protein|nr:D-alanyl-D-alanine carboxypeptidase family protein [Propionibacteriaceae bacterium]